METISDNFNSLVAAIVILLIGWTPQVGFFLAFFFVYFIFLLITSGLKIQFGKIAAKELLPRLIIWSVALSVSVGAIYYRYYSVRQIANQVVAKITDYYDAHQIYPPSLKEIGYSRAALRKQIGMFGYFVKANQANFFYAVTYVPFDTYSYDFNKGTWSYFVS